MEKEDGTLTMLVVACITQYSFAGRLRDWEKPRSSTYGVEGVTLSLRPGLPELGSAVCAPNEQGRWRLSQKGTVPF